MRTLGLCHPLGDLEQLAQSFGVPLIAGAPPWQTYPVALAGNADAVVEELVAAGVGVRRYYTPPLHRTPPFAADVSLPTTDDLSARMICLPVYSDMSDRELDEIIAIANRVLAPAFERSA